MEKLSEEERERIEKEAIEFSNYLPSPKDEFALQFGYKNGAKRECLKKNEEIERRRETYLNTNMKVLELESKLQASEEKVKELEKSIENNSR